jgi:hypothetical protein
MLGACQDIHTTKDPGGGPRATVKPTPVNETERVRFHFNAETKHGELGCEFLGRDKCPALRFRCFVCFALALGGEQPYIPLFSGAGLCWRFWPLSAVPELACILPAHDMAADEPARLRVGLGERCGGNKGVPVCWVVSSNAQRAGSGGKRTPHNGCHRGEHCALEQCVRGPGCPRDSAAVRS